MTALISTLPPQASTVAGNVDALYHFIAALSTFFFVLIVLLTVAFVIRYRHRPGEKRALSQNQGSHALELAWSVIPGILLVVIFAWGFSTFVAQAVPPDPALDVRVTAQKWSWFFQYPRQGGLGSPELIVPVGQPVKLTMSSADVIHSFYVPAFRVKQDVLPNRYTVAWFEATQPGEYDVFCTEYCGTSHSGMLSKVKVLGDAEWKAWLDSGGGMGGEGMDPAEWGGKLYVSLGCNACHSLDGTQVVGPSFKGKFGSHEALADGTSVLVDDNYVRESIVEPLAKVVAGFPPVMPTFAGRVTDAQMNALIDFIKSQQ
jgi:cytochrome c oxidase subunit 2